MERRVLDPADEAEFFAGARYATEFFMDKADVHESMEKIARRLEELEIPYAIVGAMALNLYKVRRVTVDVDVLLTRDGLTQFKERWLGRGYVEKFPGSKGLRDASNGVNIDVIYTGEYPGDGKPKPIVFPDPAEVALAGERVRILPLERFVELKLASGMSAPHRLKDLADVIALIRARNLPEDLELHEYVRPKYRELWAAAQHRDEE